MAQWVITRAPQARAAEAELCRRLAPRVRAYGLRHLREDDAANELTQRVLVLTIEKLRSGELRDPSSLGSFVLGIARNTSHSMRRAGAKFTELDDVEAVPAANAIPVLRLDLRRVATCMGELDHRQRMVLTMSLFEERSAEDIAVQVGLSSGNVRVLRHRALGALRECFERGERAA